LFDVPHAATDNTVAAATASSASRVIRGATEVADTDTPIVRFTGDTHGGDAVHLFELSIGW
jgi:hypothetical protein